MKTLIFVYGTLKRGLSNHRHLLGQHFLAEARTAAGYQLFDLGDYPGMIEAAKAGRSIEGEIWEVDAACLVELDRLEGVDEGMYERVPVRLAEPFAGAAVQTYLYRWPVEDRPAVAGRW